MSKHRISILVVTALMASVAYVCGFLTLLYRLNWLQSYLTAVGSCIFWTACWAPLAQLFLESKDLPERARKPLRVLVGIGFAVGLWCMVTGMFMARGPMVVAVMTTFSMLFLSRRPETMIVYNLGMTIGCAFVYRQPIYTPLLNLFSG